MQTRWCGIAAVLVPVSFWLAAGEDALAVEKTVRLPSTGTVEVGGQAPVPSSWHIENTLVRMWETLEEAGTRAVLVFLYASWCKECHTGMAIVGWDRGRPDHREISGLEERGCVLKEALWNS